MTVIDIRGTHGSGKSYILSQLLKEIDGWESFVGEGQATKGGPLKDRHLGYVNEAESMFIIGSYKVKSGFGGGCDLLFPEEVVKRVKRFTELFDYVVLEGVLVSHTFQRYHDLAAEIEDYRFCFLNTPLKRCIDRVRKRREGSGDSRLKPFRTDNIVKDWHQIDRVRQRCVEGGDHVVVLEWSDPMVQIYEELQ